MTQAAPPKNHLAAIHIAQKTLGLSADDAAALKIAITGKASAADMTGPQRRQYLAHLSDLQVRMGKLPRSTHAAKRPALHRTTADTNDERWLKARVLWQVLANASEVHTNTDVALMAYVHRQTKVEHWRFLNTYQINGVIESLKRWCERVNAPTEPIKKDATHG
ncbi:regulatory protein GemA [Rhodoferax aquaticus]|uniref:Regulatory protein GemA n=1 Tax=Rhodoferax aquaticus TaxID=2527691 RepID=A0A515ERL9_9BURK|nr:regulatory protein GemA [Rhodoferax aquaticus]QDL55311.1 regulatory protein GemA [Rhodoferax aquaticus]